MKKQSQYIAVAIAIIVTILFVGSAQVFAHGEGESFETEVDGYLVDVGYSVESFSDDTSVVFDFGLADQEGQDVSYSDVWVRVIRDGSTVFATGVHNARLGGASMTYLFPSEGSYELAVRFQNNGEKITGATFPLVVVKGAGEKSGFNTMSVLLLLAGLMVGLGAGFFLSRNR